MLTTEAIIRQAVRKYGDRTFDVEPKKQFISGPGFSGHISQANEKVLHLPNGQTVRVHVSEDGTVTHVEEDESQHAIVRPDTPRARFYR